MGTITTNKQYITTMEITYSRQRKRSKRRQIFCPIHGCYLESVSPKHIIYAHTAQQLREAGVDKLSASLLIREYSAIALTGDWLENFWCDECQSTHWYRVKSHKVGSSARYQLYPVYRELWERVVGVHHPDGNPTVSEFTKRQSRNRKMVKDFNFMV
jgi:hypothetical protein